MLKDHITEVNSLSLFINHEQKYFFHCTNKISNTSCKISMGLFIYGFSVVTKIG